jgi:hypothetical protein
VRYSVGGISAVPPTGEVGATMQQPGDYITMRSGGAGGFGDPRLRPVEDVRRDGREGKVTAAARHAYGVAVDPSGDVDHHAPRRLREDGGAAARSAPDHEIGAGDDLVTSPPAEQHHRAPAISTPGGW